MRYLFFLIVIGSAVGAGWYFTHQHGATPPAPNADQPGLFPSTPTISDGPADAGSPTAHAPQGNPAPSDPPPAAAKSYLDQADALWSAAGADPAKAPSAPQMDQLYSAALKALYNVPGQDARETALVHDKLTPLGAALFFSVARFPDDTTHFATYTVLPGDSPSRIAKKFGMSHQFLNRLRGRDPDDANLNIGDEIKVVKLKDNNGFFLHIDKSGFYLDCYIAGLFAKRYPVSIGAPDSPTPTGKTHLTDRCWHPDWTPPGTSNVIHYGEPGHLLGPIWLPFNKDEIGKEGVGIHGYTGNDQTSGQQVSHGCVRLQNDDSIELYNTLSHPSAAPTEVEITE